MIYYIFFLLSYDGIDFTRVRDQKPIRSDIFFSNDQSPPLIRPHNIIYYTFSQITNIIMSIIRYRGSTKTIIIDGRRCTE